mgnify:CR=1 FL=1
MNKRFAIWAYPWDMYDTGVREAACEIARLGIDTVSVATAYHSGRFLEPRNPVKKVYFPEADTVYFDLQESYGTLAPKISTLASQSPLLRPIVEECQRNNMQVAAWTVSLHNTRLGMEFPQCTTQNAFGNHNYYNLCPADPMVRSYVVTLARDISRIAGITSIELESLNFMGFDHEFHHEKDGVGLTKLQKFLLSVCFCEDCMALAQKEGIDAQEARSQVRELLDEAFSRTIPDSGPERLFEEENREFFRRWPSLYQYLDARKQPVSTLVSAIRGVVGPSTQVYFLDLFGPEDGWMYGIDYEQIGTECDGIVLCAYDSNAEQVARKVSRAKPMVQKSNLCVGLRLFYPETPSAEELRNRVQAALSSGADGISFYNYGLIPEKRLQWIKGSLVK